ncbi:CHAP domain-containing protein [Pelagibius sp.]|uniref:CHAP domain-containing protein n=1 Tax=Pelagibius sp. TaxID=1931238 RepID=UPI003BB104B1
MIQRFLAFGALALLSACALPQAQTVAEPAPRAADDQGYVSLAAGPEVAGGTQLATLPAGEAPDIRPPDARGRGLQSSFAALPRLPLPTRPRPAIISAGRHLECVPYTRKLSALQIRGNAWTWWGKAKDRYRRGAIPQAGAVMVLSKTRRLRYGHLAYVAEVMNEREVLVHQANWLNRGRIHRYTPVRDVSENNDWSVVQVWYTPGQRYGSGRYPIQGFIYPNEHNLDIRQASN